MKEKIFEVAKNHTENEETAMQLTNELCVLLGVMPRFLKTKYSLEKLDEHIHELGCRTEHWIHRGKLEDIEKLIRWRIRYDALNEV